MATVMNNVQNFRHELALANGETVGNVIDTQGYCKFDFIVSPNGLWPGGAGCTFTFEGAAEDPKNIDCPGKFEPVPMRGSCGSISGDAEITFGDDALDEDGKPLLDDKGGQVVNNNYFMNECCEDLAKEVGGIQHLAVPTCHRFIRITASKAFDGQIIANGELADKGPRIGK